MIEPQVLPVLYSLRNCPYAMRARLAIFQAFITIELRDVVLKNKPQAMLQASPKATVPILVLSENTNAQQVIDESLAVMLWALKTSDPNDLLYCSQPSALTEMLAVINVFDSEFKTAIEAYKCAKRYHEPNLVSCREACEVYIADLDTRLSKNLFLMGEKESLLDLALLPFIRQFSKIERPWYQQSRYVNIKRWLTGYIQSPMFTKVMAKYPLWHQGAKATHFGQLK